MRSSRGGWPRATAAGFSSVVVACEPTGHRWRVLDQIAAEAGVRLVCVQPLLVHRARESEDFTHNKSDETDAIIIARLVTELRCYLPERADPTQARLRHLGARRAGLVTDAIARTAAAGDYSGGKRLYGYVNGDLLWVGEKATPEIPLRPYMSAQLKKVVDPREWVKDLGDLPDDGIAFFR